MAAPDLTYVTVNYHSERLLRAGVEAFLDDVGDLSAEVVVVDNGSSEDASYLDDVVSRAEHGVLLRNDRNVGFARAVNQAAARARGRYILLVNPDTYLHPGTVRALVETLDAHPNAALAGPRVLDPDGSIQGSARRFPGIGTVLFGRNTLLTRLLPGNPVTRSQFQVSVDPSRDPYPVDWVSGACMLIRRDAFLALGGFDEQYFLYWEDADLCRRFHLAGRDVLYVPRGALTHLVGWSANHRPYGAISDFHRSVALYVRKHLPWTRPLPVRALVLAGLKARVLLRCALHLATSLPRRGQPLERPRLPLPQEIAEPGRSRAA